MPEICRETKRNIPIRNGCRFQKQFFFSFMFPGILPSREEGSMKTSTNKHVRKIQARH